MPLILTVLIVGALIGVGTTLIGPRVKLAKYTDAARTLSAAVDAVTGWSAASGRLPDAAGFAVLVPASDDPWRRPLVYAYDSGLAAAAAGGICGRRTTPISDNAGAVVAFVVISGGDDRTIGSTPGAGGAFSGVVVPADGDVLQSVTLARLKALAGCQGAAAGRLRIINDTLPAACTGQPYSAAIHAEGGAVFPSGGDYKWCIKGALPAGLAAMPATPACPATADCGSLGPETASQWSQTTALSFSGTPSAAGSFPLTVLTRDDNDGDTAAAMDNCVEKRLLITVQACGGGPPPVSSWDFDEGSGTTAGDGAAGHDGTLAGDAAWSGDTPAGTGAALAFGGAGHVRIASDADFRITGALTLGAWIKAAADRPFAKVLSRRLGNYFYFLGVDGGHPYGGVGDGTTRAVTGKSLLMSLSTWNHLAFVYDDDADRMFIHFDGTERETATALVLPATAGIDVTIGADSQGSAGFFKGAIDEVAVYARALSAAEIRQIAGGTVAAPPVALYRFSSDAADSSGNGHDGLISGAAFTADRAGTAASALVFDGNDAVRISDHPDFHLTGQLTVMAWVRETAPGAYAKVLARRTGNDFYFLGVDGGRPYGGIGDGSATAVTRKSIAMAPGLWHHIAFVHSQAAGTIQIYFNGIVDDTAVTVSLPDMDGIDLTIGADSQGSDNFFEGLIDAVRIFDRALTADEIRQSY